MIQGGLRKGWLDLDKDLKSVLRPAPTKRRPLAVRRIKPPRPEVPNSTCRAGEGGFCGKWKLIPTANQPK